MRASGGRGPSCLRRRLAAEDLRQAVDVDLVEDAPPARALQAHDELGAQDVDLAVQDPAVEADLTLLLLEVADHGLELVVGERAEIGDRVHSAAFRLRGVESFQQRVPEPSTSG